MKFTKTKVGNIELLTMIYDTKSLDTRNIKPNQLIMETSKSLSSKKITYDIDYFINKFENIPLEKWGMNEFINDKGCMCAFGHCGARIGKCDTEESDALFNIDRENSGAYINVVSVNDDILNKMDFGTTIKERVIKYLKSLKAKQP